MEKDLKVRNIVLVGFFNPTEFDKFFFIKNEIFSESEISPNSIFSDIQGSRIVTDKFLIVITLNQIIISVTNPSDDLKLERVAAKIIMNWKAQLFSAFGINFHWFLSAPGSQLTTISKELFYRDNIKILSEYFNYEDALFGSYASKDIKNSRLKLDITPLLVEGNPKVTTKDGFNFVFNFHFDLKDKLLSDALEYLNDYNYYFEESKKIVSL